MAIAVTLVGSSDEELLALLRRAGGVVTSIPAEGLRALSQPGAAQPHVLVVDLRNSARLPVDLAPLKRQHPFTGVILVSSSHDPGLMLEAMRAGVNEWLTDPVSAPDLDAALARVVEQQIAPAAAHVIAFVGAKGGVGTTTVAVNVATAIARASEAPTLLIDLHLAHGDAAVFLGTEPRFSVADALDNTHRFDEAFFRSLVIKTPAGVDLLGSSERPLTMSIEVSRIRAVLEFATRFYRYIVLDVPRSDGTVLDALDGVAKLVVVANQELATVRNASRLALSLRQRYGGDKVQVVISRYDRHSAIGQDDVEKAVGAKVKHSFPSDYRLVVQAVNQGQPLVLGNHSQLAASLESFAADLAGITATAEKPERSRGGLLGRLTGRR